MALEPMINIAKSVDTIIDDNLKIENLVKIGIPVIEDYDGSLAVDITKVDDVLQNAVAMGAGVIGTGNIFSDGINIDLNKDGKNDIEIGGINDFIEKVINKDDGSTPESQDGINSEVALESGEDSSSVGIIDEQGSLEQQESSSIKGEDGVNSTDNGESEFVSNNEVDSPQDNVDNSVPSSDISDSNSENKKTEDNESSIVDDSTNSQVSEEGTNSSIVLEKNDNAENSVVEETVVDEEIKPSAEDIALNNDIQSTKIENDYKEIDVSESSELSYKNVENEGDVEKKGAGILAGAAGIGALSNININSGGDIPQVNGMAAGEILGMNIGNDSSTIGIALENIPNSSVSDGSVNTSSLVNSSVGGESTSDRGIVTKDNSLNKENTSGGSGKGRATLEDKSNQQEENVNVKNNSEEDNKTNTKKGLLGDASIAELEAKDKKEIRIATGASTATIISSGVLALLNVLPWLMLLLIFVTVVFYAGYRVKKNKDKDKRMKAMNDVGSPSTNKNVNSLEMVQNVSEVENNGVKQSVSGNGDEFSEQPYEPLRDGVTEIGVRSSENE